MTDTDDRPTIAEVYGLAATCGVPCDIIAAAGMQSSRLGAMLLRLQAEYDGVRVDLERAGRIQPRSVQEVKSLRRRAKDYLAAADLTDSEITADHLKRQAKLLLSEALQIEERRTPKEIVSAREFIVAQLKTLVETKREVGELAVRMAKKRGIDIEVALKLAGRVLDVYLDPLCHHCDGTGEIGSGYRGESRVECRVCKGSTHRRDILGNQLAETMMAADLLAELQRQASNAAHKIGAALAFSADPVSTEPRADVRERLAELRSPEAERD